jgi:hypothetical protein
MALPVPTTRPGPIQEQNTFEGSNSFCDEFQFDRMFKLERKRTQRSGKPFILIHITGLMNSCRLGGVNVL